MKWLPVRTSVLTRRILPMVFGMFLFVFLVSGSAFKTLAIVQKPLVFLGTSVFRWTYFTFASPALTSQDIEDLIQQRDAYALDRVEYEYLQIENQELNGLLAFTQRTSYETLAASIIARSTSDTSQTFLIDKGKDDGLIEGQPVIVGDGILIGKVWSLDAHTATVRGILHPESTIAVSLVNSNRTIGLVQGGEKNLLTMAFIPHDQTIEVNNLVVTSGLEEELPSGLVVGIVNAVESNSDLPFITAIVEPMTDARMHSAVLVLLSKAL